MSTNDTARRRIPFFDDLVLFYEQSPLSFPATDIFCCGPFSTVRRLAALVNVLCMMRDHEKRFPISRIIAVLSPISTEGLENEESRLDNVVLDVMTRLHGQKAAASQARFLKALLRVMRCPNFEVETAVSLIEKGERFSVLIFLDAAKYRQNGLRIERPEGPAALIPEDLWVHHLRSFAERSVAAATQRNCYVVLDAGEASPYKAENAEVLRSVNGCGVLGSQIMDDPREIVATKLDGWARQVRAGVFGQAFSEIDALPESLNREKQLLKIQLLSQAALPVQMLEFLHEEEAEIAEINPDVLVRFSRFAQTAGDVELASKFLAHAIPSLTSQEELELALSISSEIDDAVLEDTCSRRLEALFPHSRHLYQQRLTNLIDSRRYSEAATTASHPIPGFSAEVADFYKELASKLEGTSQPDYQSTLDTIRSRWPTLSEPGLLICAADARARKLPKEALRLLLTSVPAGRMSQRLAISYLRSIEQALIQGAEGRRTMRDDIVRESVSELIRYLSRNPDDGTTRGGLITVLSPPISGTAGLGFIAIAALELSQQGVAIRPQAIQHRPSVDLRDLSKFVEPILEWLSRQSPVAIGRCKLPGELLTVPADNLIGPLERLLQGEAGRVATEADWLTFEKLLFAAVLIARHSSDPDDDLRLLHLGAAKLARGGRVQRARDLAEEALQIAGESPRRARIAWYTFADVYQRVQNPVEALMGMACTLACKAEITTEQAWYETYLLIRLLRDLHMTEIAKSLLPFAHSLVQELGPEGEYLHRFVTLELSVRLIGLLDARSTAEAKLQRFVSDARRLCLTVLERNDEIAPAATLLAQGVYMCQRRRLAVPDDAFATLELALTKVGDTFSAFIRTLTIQTPKAAEVLSLAQRLEPARYASDTGFDLGYVVMAARRLLDCSQAANNSLECAMAIELLADQALRRHAGISPTHDALHGLPTSVREPGEFAQEYSRLGIRVVLLGLSANHDLIRVIADKGVLGAAVREDSGVFSKARLDEWSKRFPYGYANVSETDNLFYTTMRGLGLTIEESGRALFVMDAALAQLPPNLLLVSGEFVGRRMPVAAVPSLAWLRSARNDRRKTTGKRMAWIPTAANKGDNSTLAMVAERLEPTFLTHSIQLVPSSEIPTNLGGSDLVVVAAHGGIVPEGRFFQVVADDIDLRVSSDDLSKALNGVELVILFVCSGGRFDPHPFANTTVGLAKDLLNRGCTTVIASPWPLDARVPSHWLPQFLALWERGCFVVGANFEANNAVEKAMGDSPARCLAMTIFGDPLLTKR
jgi:CHAT domain